MSDFVAERELVVQPDTSRASDDERAGTEIYENAATVRGRLIVAREPGVAFGVKNQITRFRRFYRSGVRPLSVLLMHRYRDQPGPFSHSVRLWSRA